MNTMRGIFMLVGVVVVVFGAYLLYDQADLNRWVGIGIVTAGILIFVGLAIMAFAGGSKADPPAPAQPSNIVQDNREVKRTDRRE